jgi:hypothetical protein
LPKALILLNHDPDSAQVGLVLLEERTAGRVPTLEEVRTAVSGEWMNEERLRANAVFYQDLLKRYKLVIDAPNAADSMPATAIAQ